MSKRKRSPAPKKAMASARREPMPRFRMKCVKWKLVPAPDDGLPPKPFREFVLRNKKGSGKTITYAAYQGFSAPNGVKLLPETAPSEEAVKRDWRRLVDADEPAPAGYTLPKPSLAAPPASGPAANSLFDTFGNPSYLPMLVVINLEADATLGVHQLTINPAPDPAYVTYVDLTLVGMAAGLYKAKLTYGWSDADGNETPVGPVDISF